MGEHAMPIPRCGHSPITEFWHELLGGDLAFVRSRRLGLSWAHKTVRVLLAHSDPHFRRAVKAGLTQLGFAIDEVADGPGLLERLGDVLLDGGQNPKPDIVIADLDLRGFDRLGFLVASRMFGVQTPWILTTLRRHPTDPQPHKSIARAVLVEFPMDWVDFLTVISVLLERSQRPRPVIPGGPAQALRQLAASA